MHWPWSVLTFSLASIVLAQRLSPTITVAEDDSEHLPETNNLSREEKHMAIHVEKSIERSLEEEPTFDDTIGQNQLPPKEKHIPIRQSARNCCESPLVFTFDSMPVLPTYIKPSKTCSLPTSSTTTSPSTFTTSKTTTSSCTTRRRHHKKSKTSEKCITTMVDPQTVYVTRTTTTFSTLVRTVRSIIRETSFSTTTRTTTLKFTSTVLSISALTKFSSLFVTLPSYVLKTKYNYIDITSTSFATVPTFVLSATELETIIQQTGLTLFIETTFTDCTFIEDILTITGFGPTVITFTDITQVTEEQAPTTTFFTETLTFEVTTTVTTTLANDTTNFLVPSYTEIIVVTEFSVDVVPYTTGTTYFTQVVINPNPVTFVAASSTYSVTIQ